MNKFICYIAFICLLPLSLSSFGQTRKELEKRRQRIKKEIKQVNSLLFETKKKKSGALEDLKDLNQKISIRERLIETIELEADVLEKEINHNEKEINTYSKELANLKSDYAAMVVKTHKSKSLQSRTMFILSSKSFYQAYKRLKYMQQYNEFRKKQGEKISEKTEYVKKLNDSLATKLYFKERLMGEEKTQQEAFENDKKNQETLVKKIKKQESSYRRSLLKKQKEEKKVAAQIDKLIREAIANANKAKGAKKSGEFSLNAEEKVLLANFEQNKGNLPWPVQGIVTRKYGIQPHPSFPGIQINSPGLHIVSKKDSDAKSIFNGKVLVIQRHSDGRKSVYVQHGSYISTYNNLEKVYVKKGDNVKTSAKLGKIFTDKITGKTKLIFVLYKNTKRLNPSVWIQ